MSWFGKKNKSISVDKVFISFDEKVNAIKEITTNEKLNIICWFEESFDKINEILNHDKPVAEIFMTRQLSSHISGPMIFFEHHPSAKKEKELFEKLQLKEAIFYSSLDEPLFKIFGGEKIAGLVKTLGIKANESLEHPMISSSIKNAQEKIDKRLSIESGSRSQEEWLERNVGGTGY